MKHILKRWAHSPLRWLVLLALALSAGCATARVDWGSRVGQYSFDDAVREYGPPDKEATLQDGSRVAEWLTSHGVRSGGYAVRSGPWVNYYPDMVGPDYFLRLTFNAAGRLAAFKKVAR